MSIIKLDIKEKEIGSMINKSNLEAMLKSLGYVASKRKKVLEKKYEQYDCTIEVDFNGAGTIKYPEDKGLKITHHTTISCPMNIFLLPKYYVSRKINRKCNICTSY